MSPTSSADPCLLPLSLLSGWKVAVNHRSQMAPMSDSSWPATCFWWSRADLGIVFKNKNKNNDFRKKEKQSGRKGQKEERWEKGKKGGREKAVADSKARFILIFKAKERGLWEGSILQ